MWGRRKKRCSQLSRQLALGALEDAMGRVQQPPEPEAGEPMYPGSVAAPAVPPAQADLGAADVPVDNTAAPDPPDPPDPLPRALPAQRTGESTRHGTFG